LPPPRVADELVEEGLLIRGQAPDGTPAYALSEEGAKFAAQLLEESPSARAYLDELRGQGKP
jgi:hypothetical protein